jgi:hypothetical protein
MYAHDVLLGRIDIRGATRTRVGSVEGAGFARAILKGVFVAVIMFESMTADPILDLGTYLHRGLESWTPIPLVATPLELLLICGVIAALAAAVAAPASSAPAKLGWPVGLFGVCLALGVVRGALGGGDMYIGLWEVRYLAYVPAAFVIARLCLRTVDHVFGLLGAGLAAAGLFAVEGVYRKITLINTGLLGVIPERYFEHDDVIFLATFLIFAFSMFVFRVPGRMRLLGMLVASPLLLVLLASNRRSGVVVLLIGVLVVALVLLVINRRAFVTAVIPGLTALTLFLALTWNAGGLLGQPARALRSLYEPDARDAASNVYRAIETYDISATLHDEPLLAVGFGREFRMAIQLPDLSWWPFWHFETHNNVLWIWLKTGVCGYVMFWILIGTAISRAAFSARRLIDPRLRSAALFCLVALVGVVVYGWVDLAFVSGRTTVLLGTVLGIIAVLDRLDRPRLEPLAPVRSR